MATSNMKPRRARKRALTRELSPQLEVGYAKRDITPPIGGPLSGMIAPRGRNSTSVRDPLHARALTVHTGDVSATLLVADLLTIPAALHGALAERVGIDPAHLLASATHTHSGPGGYWDVGKRAELIAGPYSAETFERLVDQLVETIVASRAERSPTTIEAATAAVPGGNANRRQLHGPVDPDLTLVRFRPEAGSPIDLVSFSAHPVIVSECDSTAISADFPGALCARIEARDTRALFFQGAVGALSPLFPEFPLRVDPHLELVTNVLERGWLEAEAKLEATRPDGPFTFELLRLELPPVNSRFFPDGLRFHRQAERAVFPIAHFLRGMGKGGRRAELDAPLHLFRLGDVALLGTPCDLGVGVSLELKRALTQRGVRFGIPGSQCDGYLGYVLMPEDYEHVPEPGFRFLAYYENAMSLAGWQMGADFVTATRDRLGLDP